MLIFQTYNVGEENQHLLGLIGFDRACKSFWTARQVTDVIGAKP